MDDYRDSILVLYVDDDPGIRELVDLFFERRGGRISMETVADGRAALDRIDERVDCIVSDYDMSGMNGLDLLRSVRSTHPDVPFILHTGKGSERVASEAISAGVTDYFEKTGARDAFTVLGQRIENVVDHRRTEVSYRELFEKATEGFALNDPETGAFLDANESMLACLGYDRADLVEMGLDDVTTVPPQADRERTLLGQMRRASEEEVVVIEEQVRRPDGTERWLELQFKPIRVNGRTLALTQARDVTERRRHRVTRSTLRASIADLVGIDRSPQVVDRTLTTVAEGFGVDRAAVFFYDAANDRLELVDERPRGTVTGPVTDPLLSRTFIAGTSIEADDAAVFDPVEGRERERTLLVPLGDHGVLAIGTDGPDPFDTDERASVEMLSNAASAALDRIERDDEIDSTRQEIRDRVDEMERVRAANAVLRDLSQAFVRAETCEELYATVCERLGALDPVELAWIATPGLDGALEPAAWTGAIPQYLDTVSLAADSAEPASVAARTGEPVRVDAVAQDLRTEQWRRTAMTHGVGSVMAVPFEVDGTVRGVLSVLAADRAAFRDCCDEVVLAIANAVGETVERLDRQRGPDVPTDVSFEIDGDEQLFGRLAAETGGRLDVRGVVAESATAHRAFVRVTGCAPAAFCAAANERATVRTASVVDGREDGTVELQLATPVLGLSLAEFGAEVSRLRATETAVRVTVSVARPSDVRPTAEAVTERYPTATLRSKQQRADVVREHDQLVAFREALTPRQREVLQVAYLNGYFESPRQCTGEQLGSDLGISAQAVYQHIRAAQRKLLEETFARSIRVPMEAEA